MKKSVQKTDICILLFCNLVILYWVKYFPMITNYIHYDILISLPLLYFYFLFFVKYLRKDKNSDVFRALYFNVLLIFNMHLFFYLSIKMLDFGIFVYPVLLSVLIIIYYWSYWRRNNFR